jgi:hypothetical protein
MRDALLGVLVWEAISILFIALVWARDVDCMLERASHNLAISSR